MPELPEVETIRRGLDERLPGLVITGVEVRVPKLFEGDSESLVGRTVVSVERQGKLLIIQLDAGWLLTIHLKMTGQLIWQGDEEIVGGHPEKAYLEPLPHKYTHVIFSFDDGSRLFFNDLRKFGRITVMREEELSKTGFIEGLGPEPLEADFTVAYLKEQLKIHGKTTIKSFLLDQHNIAGLGNIYADESLFRAAVMPSRQAGTISSGEAQNLFDGIQETLELAILHGGSTSRDYVNAAGEKGTYLAIANVYHRTGLLCNRCHDGLIQRKMIGGRSSHYCPICQR